MRTLVVLALVATAAPAQMPGMMGGGNLLMGPSGGTAGGPGGMMGGPGGMPGGPGGGMPSGGPPPWLADLLDPDAPPPPPPPPWSGILDLGANGQTGNTDLLSFRANGQASRKTADNLFTLSATYMLTRLSPTGLIGGGAAPPGLPAALLANAPAPTGQTITQQQAFAYLWDEFLQSGRVWNPFVSGLFEYDEFRDYKYRSGAFAGANGHLLDTPTRVLAVRVGAGAVYETGSVGSRWVPEGLFGFTGSQRFWDRHSLSGGVDLFPRLNQVGQYRMRLSASWDIQLDPERRYLLRLGVQDRYDSDPGRKKRNDLSYFSSIGVRL